MWKLGLADTYFQQSKTGNCEEEEENNNVDKSMESDENVDSSMELDENDSVVNNIQFGEL
jgi:hypothetical protein